MRTLRTVLLLLAGACLLAGPRGLEDALAAIQAGRPAEAEQILLSLQRQQPKDENVLFALGMLYVRTNQPARAVSVLEQVTRVAPSRSAGWKALGVAYATLSEHGNATHPFSEACRLTPTDAEACYLLARNHYVLNRFEEAIALYRTLLPRDPHPWRIHNGLGLALEGNGDPEPAEGEFRKAIKLLSGAAPGDEDPRINLGVLLVRMARGQEALPVLEEAVRANPSSARAHLELGKLLMQLGRAGDAVAALERSVALNPASQAAHSLLGKLYYRLGNPQKAAHHTAKAQQLLESR